MDNVELQPLSPDQVVSLHVEASSGQEHQEHDVIETNDETNDVVDQPANSNQHQDETDDVVSGLLDQKGADLRNRLKAQIYGLVS